MTSLPLPASDGPAVLIDPDRLLAAIPGLLGFIPERSLVLLAFEEPATLIASMRQDLGFTDTGRPDTAMRAQLRELGEIVAGFGAAGVVAVVVDDRFDRGDAAAELVRYGAVFRAVEGRFGEAGGVCAGFVIGELSVGAEWFTAWEPYRRAGRHHPPAPLRGPIAASGRLSDPLLSPVALERAVYGGRPVLSRRSDLIALLDPRPHCDDRRCVPVVPVLPPGPPGEDDAQRVRLVLEAVGRGADASMSCGRVNRLAEALCSVHTRDVLLALALTDLRDRAEHLWLRLARSLRGRPGAAAATLLGHSHYLAGEGAFASIAIERALDLDPEYHLAQLLDSALIHGLRPAGLGDVVDYSFDLAGALGLTLPPRTRRPAG